jgi:hypothetical protein
MYRMVKIFRGTLCDITIVVFTGVVRTDFRIETNSLVYGLGHVVYPTTNEVIVQINFIDDTCAWFGNSSKAAIIMLISFEGFRPPKTAYRKTVPGCKHLIIIG